MQSDIFQIAGVFLTYGKLMTGEYLMHRFYVDSNSIYYDKVLITGSDVNHIRNVLRMNRGDRIIVNDKNGNDYYCVITQVDVCEVVASVESVKQNESELKTKLYLFQALPKADKMELIIQKAVELGVHEIIPMQTARCVVKLDNGTRKQKKIARWQAIAESAAKQSSRGIIPIVKDVMSYSEAVEYAEKLEYNIIPYERAEGMEESRKAIEEAAEKDSIGIFIGPEGGYEDNEVEKAIKSGFNVVSLGKRILRTETAGMCMLSIIMFRLSE